MHQETAQARIDSEIKLNRQVGTLAHWGGHLLLLGGLGMTITEVLQKNVTGALAAVGMMVTSVVSYKMESLTSEYEVTLFERAAQSMPRQEQ